MAAIMLASSRGRVRPETALKSPARCPPRWAYREAYKGYENIERRGV